MSNINQVVIQGRLGADAQSEFTQSGTARLKFSLANSERYKNASGEPQEKTNWVYVSYYGKGAEALAPYLTKGKHVTVAGRLSTWESEGEDGNRKRGFEVVAQTVQLSPKTNGETANVVAAGDDDDEDEAPAPRRKAPQGKRQAATDASPW